MRRYLSVLAFSLAVAGAARAQTAPAARPALAGDPGAEPAYAAAIAEARRLILDTMRVVGAPGAQITVLRDGEVVWSEGFGWADLEQRVPVTPLTRFRVGSVSKSLTAAALGLLVEEGKLDLDAPVQRYVPGFPRKRWPVTTRQAAGHLAGIRHYLPGEFESRRHYATVAEGLAIFQADTLLFEPGTRYAYSSYGYNLVSAVLEGASRRPFLALMHERVFAPLGMRHTVAEHVDSLIPFRARFYTRDTTGGRAGSAAGGIVNAPWVDNSYKWAGGGFLSTTEDLARFAQGLLAGRLLKAETLRLLWTSQRTRDGKETGYGIGWSVTTDSAGRRRVGHTGGSMGGTANLIVYPEQRLVVALLVNSDHTFIGAAPRIAEGFLRAAPARMEAGVR
jgi:CubicO group peptidase (beta-lactamase class C family)